MPHKRNLISSEIILVRSKLLSEHHLSMLDAMVLDHERATGQWHVEWYALPNAFHENSMEDEEKCLRVLGTSVIALTKKYINDMISNGGGKIMIVSSVAAFAPASSLQSLYGPVKTFMNRFSESLSFYNKYGVTSTAVCPGYTVTNFHTASGVQKEMDSVPSFLKKSAKRIAEEGVDAMMKGKKVSVPTKTWKIIVFLLKVIPQSVFSLISGLLAPGRYDDV